MIPSYNHPGNACRSPLAVTTPLLVGGKRHQ